MTAAPAPALMSPQTFHLPKPPTGDSAAARQLAVALRHGADDVVAAQLQAHRLLEDAYQRWTGCAATAMRHPLAELDVRTHRVSSALRDAAAQLDHYAKVLDRAHHQHHWSWAKITKVAVVVAVTTTVVVVTVGAAAPAAAAADAALVEAEVATTAAAVATAGSAAADAAQAVSLAVRALQLLRPVATFLRPQVVVTAGLTDYDAYRQVRTTGDLDPGALVGHAGTNLAYGAIGSRLAGPLGALGADAANPVLQWVLPKLAQAGGWASTAAAEDYLLTGRVDGWRTAEAGATSVGASVIGGFLPRLGIGEFETPVAPRRVNFYPRGTGKDPNWGLTDYHLDRHVTGVGPLSLRTIDPGGSLKQWGGYIQDLAGRPATSVRERGVFQIMGRFPRADGNGTFRLGIRLSPEKDGSYDLVTLLTEQ